MDAENPTELGWSEETSRLFINYGRYFVPGREQQMQIMAGLLSSLDGPNHLIDLCCGEGLLDEVLLATFPEFTIQGLDGSVEMLRRARERLARFGNRFAGCEFDLAAKAWRTPGQPINAVISSIAIHHLLGPQKQELFREVFQMLEKNGVFIIADIVEHPGEMGRHQAAEALDEVVRKRSIEIDGNTAAFDFFQREGWNIYRTLDPEDIDKPSPLFDQLKWLEQAGFSKIDVHWMLAGHAIFSACKSVNTEAH
jgi:ubiquinone/menaquinone biosynthesis C-methylase UbiE